MLEIGLKMNVKDMSGIVEVFDEMVLDIEHLRQRTINTSD